MPSLFIVANHQECTDNTTLSGQERKAEQVRTAPFKSREAQMVKLAE